MKVKAVIKKIKSHFKKQGVDITISAPTKNGDYKWKFRLNGYEGSFSANGHDGYSAGWEDADACLFHVRGVNDISDLHTDYHAGSFRDNISQVCESLLPSPPKFTAGDLVRGKSNKRAIRQGYAGKVGLVMESTGWPRVAWTGERPTSYGGWPSYPERDLELAT